MIHRIPGGALVKQSLQVLRKGWRRLLQSFPSPAHTSDPPGFLQFVARAL